MLPSDTHLKKGLEVNTNETIPDGQIQSAPIVNVLADCLSMVWNADKNIGLLSLANVNKSIFPNCFSSSISLSSYLLCYRKTAAELKEELNILHLELYDKSENFSGDALHKHFFLSNKWGTESSILHWDFSFKLQFLESNALILLNLKARKHFNSSCRKQQVILLLSVGKSSRYSKPFHFPLTSPCL